MDEWKKNRRKKQLDKINNELEDLKRKGLQFEGNAPRKKINSEEPVKIARNGGLGLVIVSLLLIIILAIGWGTTHFSKKGVVDDFTMEVDSLGVKLELKDLQIENLSTKLSNLNSVINEKEKSESELSDEYADLEELNELMQEKIDDFEEDIVDLNIDISNLKGNLTEEKEIVDGYEDCITDNDGPFNENLNVCEDYID